MRLQILFFAICQFEASLEDALRRHSRSEIKNKNKKEKKRGTSSSIAKISSRLKHVQEKMDHMVM